MAWIGLLLIGFGLTDLVHSASHRRQLPEYVGALAIVVIGMLAGLTGLRDICALIVIAALTIAWGRGVTRGFADNRPGLPLGLLAGSLALAIVLAPLAADSGGPLQDWLDQAPLPLLAHVRTTHFLVVLGATLVQLSTGNVVVRLVLSATHTISPMRHDSPSEPERQLKGGRLLGPMERLVIFGLGLSGYLTAASVVIAAKGLLRFPELSSRRDQERIHLLTEYFLVGSFVSWLTALGALLLSAR